MGTYISPFGYNGHERWSWMVSLSEVLARIGSWGKNIYHIHGDEYTRVRDPRSEWTDIKTILPPREYHDWVSRRWYFDMYRKFEFHPVIKAAVLLAPPADWHRLVLEFPHIAESDPTRLAYTRDNRDGLTDKQLITTVGKYLHRHFPLLPDHTVRDLTARYAMPHEFKISRDMDEMLDLLRRGPNSCMRWDDDDDDDGGVPCLDGQNRHPYHVYDPALGWGLAVRMDGRSVEGRALVCDQDNRKIFVRSYKRGNDYSYADEALQHWLESQGYEKRDGYPNGTKLRYYPIKTRWGDEGVLAPFIDGGNREVTVDARAETMTITITRNGEWMCDNTDGRASELNSSRYVCSGCDERVHEDDLVSTYDGNGDSVCESCIEHNYYYVYGRRGYEYYVHENDMVEVRGHYYHDQYLSDNNIVELENGDYEEMDYAICINDCWYSTDDEDIVLCVDNDEYAIANEDCWECEHNNQWYSYDVDPVVLCILDDKRSVNIHPDFLYFYEPDIKTIDATLTIEGA